MANVMSDASFVGIRLNNVMYCFVVLKATALLTAAYSHQLIAQLHNILSFRTAKLCQSRRSLCRVYNKPDRD